MPYNISIFYYCIIIIILYIITTTIVCIELYNVFLEIFMWEMWLFSTLIFCAHEFVRWYFLWRFTENKVHYSLFSVNLHGKRTIIFAIFCEDNLGIHGRWRHLTTPKLLLLTNQCKLTLTVTLTLTDTVTVIFFSRISSTPIKRLYRNNKRNFCGGAAARFVGGPFWDTWSLAVLIGNALNI